MSINEDLTSVYLEIKQANKWDDDFFIDLLKTCNVPRQVISDYYDRCVFNKGMKPLEELENIGEIRERVMKTELPKKEKLRLGKCIAFLQNLNNGS